jgi:cell division transport system permease protein
MKTSGATTAVTRRKDRLSAWLAHHKRVCLSTLQELAAHPMDSMMTWLVIGIALGLPAILTVMLQNVSEISGDWGGKPRISLYLVQEAPLDAARKLADQVRNQDGVELVKVVTADQALKEFQHRSGFGEVLSTLDRNPLPHVVEVIPIDAEPLKLSGLIGAWDSNELVDRVSVDLQWLERLYALLSFAERMVTALALVLGLGVMLVMGNTIRLAIENRRAEIEIVKLVGGTDSFVRRPFLYLGFWYGVGGAVFAFLLVQLSLIFLSSPVEMLAQSYRNDFALTGPGIIGNLTLLLLGAVLGVLGSVLAVSRHLSAIEPT